MVLIKCSKCKKSVRVWKGFKLKPFPVCPDCVFLNEEFICKNNLCGNEFKRKEGYLDECWTCGNPLCFKCVKKEVTIEGVEFSFCEEHKKPNMKELKEDALRLIEEEKLDK